MMTFIDSQLYYSWVKTQKLEITWEYNKPLQQFFEKH